MAFEPVVDGELLGRDRGRLAAGAGRHVDLLVGTNRDEHRLFLVPTGVMDATDDAALGAVAGALGLAAGGLGAYRMGSESAGEALAEVLTDWFFRIPAIRLAEAHQGDSYMYEFGWKSPRFDGRLGACHGLEIGFVFDTLDAEGETACTVRRGRRRAGRNHAQGVGRLRTDGATRLGGLRPARPARR